MRRGRRFTEILWLLSLVMGDPVQAQVMMEVPSVADAVVRRMDLARGERVLFVAVPGHFNGLIAALRERITRAGGLDLGVVPARGDGLTAWETEFTRGAAGLNREALAGYFSGVDLAIMMPGAAVGHVPYAAMQDVLASGSGRTIHFHWAGAYSFDGQPLDVSIAIAELYQRAILATDYDALAAQQRRFEQAMRGAEIRVTTPAGTDLSFRIGDRPVTKQDGDASAVRAAAGRNLIDREIELPAGAIRVAPIEESVNGRIAFPPSDWARARVEGLVMTFARGRVTAIEARSGRDAVERELDQAGDAGRTYREFALGFNPLLAIPETEPRWIPYYGYGAGVVRLSLGDNTELGGRVGGGYVRWNFFTDATVTVGGDVWVRDGRLVR